MEQTLLCLQWWGTLSTVDNTCGADSTLFTAVEYSVYSRQYLWSSNGIGHAHIVSQMYIVSNAEEKSSKAGTDMLPLLRERNRSLTTFRRAVSVL